MKQHAACSKRLNCVIYLGSEIGQDWCRIASVSNDADRDVSSFIVYLFMGLLPIKEVLRQQRIIETWYGVITSKALSGKMNI